MSEIDEIITYLQEQGTIGVLVAESGQLDVSVLLAAGWTLGEEEVVMHGKRIRTLTPPPDAFGSVGKWRTPDCCCRRGAARGEEGMEFVCAYCPVHVNDPTWACARHV